MTITSTIKTQSEAQEQLLLLALEIALTAPLRRVPPATTTTIDWSIVERIRNILDEAGVNWNDRAKSLRK